MDDDTQQQIVSVRFPEKQLVDLDRVVERAYPDRSTAIRTATGEMLLDQRLADGRADSIDRFIADYRETDTPLRDAVFASLTDIDLSEGRPGYMGSARLEYGNDRFYGRGTGRGETLDDLVETVYGEITERAVNRYGFDLE